VQLATAEFMREGHYMRHLRRMKRVYSRRRDALKSCLETRTHDALIAGLAVLLRLPDGVQDTAVAKDALAFGLAPAPLSPWYMSSRSSRPGLLLGVASVPDQRLQTSCDRLYRIIDRRASELQGTF
jgi:GntR family transcriptional regulator/MocR family aminotransferase